MSDIYSVTDRTVWDTFVENHCPYALFQHWDWGCVQEALGTSIWRFGYFANKKLCGVSQVVKIQARRGTFLHIRHGPIVEDGNKKIWEAFLSYLKILGKKEHAMFIRISPLVEPCQEEFFKHFGFLSSAIHAMDAERCLVLDLKETDDALLTNMRKTTRYEIRRAEKLGVKVQMSENINDVETFLSLYKKTSSRHGFVEHHGLKEEFSVFKKNSNAVLFFAWYEDMCIASALVLFVGGQAIYHHGASIPSSSGASNLLQWRAIQEAKKRGMKLYNFWGIAPEGKAHHPWNGLTLFKKGFGGKIIEYLHAMDLPLSPWYVGSYAIEYFRKVRKGY